MRRFIFLLSAFVALLLSPPGASAISISSPQIDAEIATYNAKLSPQDEIDRDRFVIGTGSFQRLLYGFPNIISTSYTTIKIQDPGNAYYIFGAASGTTTAGPANSLDAFNNTLNTVVWWPAPGMTGIKVTQELAIVPNPRDGIDRDTVRIKYILDNYNTFTARAGVRVELDTQLGFNDTSPITASGIGRIPDQVKLTGAAVPQAWLTEDNIDNPQIKAEGILQGFGATTPDELIIGMWANLNESTNIWDFNVQPLYITDTAVAIFWYPVPITAGGEASFVTYYGIPGYSGAELSVTKTVDKNQAVYGDTLSYNIDYQNAGDSGLTMLYIWDTIPANTTFVDGSPGYDTWTTSGVVFWDLASGTMNPGDNGAQWFSVSLTACTGLSVDNSAVSSYTDNYWNDREDRSSNKVTTGILTATITQTSTITPTHTISPTFTITPTVTDTPVPLIMTDRGPFPNPSSHQMRLVFHLTREANMTLKIFTVTGELVRQIAQDCQAGNNAILWDHLNIAGKRVSSGVYLYMLEAVTERNEENKHMGKMAVVE